MSPTIHRLAINYIKEYLSELDKLYIQNDMEIRLMIITFASSTATNLCAYIFDNLRIGSKLIDYTLDSKLRQGITVVDYGKEMSFPNIKDCLKYYDKVLITDVDGKNTKQKMLDLIEALGKKNIEKETKMSNLLTTSVKPIPKSSSKKDPDLLALHDENWKLLRIKYLCCIQLKATDVSKIDSKYIELLKQEDYLDDRNELTEKAQVYLKALRFLPEPELVPCWQWQIPNS